MIAHWPQGIAASLSGTLVGEPTHVIDLMATCVDLSGANYPESYKGNDILPLEGKSLRPIFQGKPIHRQDALYFEHYGNRGVRLGKWKLVSEKAHAWELYDMQNDRTELNDLAAIRPEKVKELSVLYIDWSNRSFVKKINEK